MASPLLALDSTFLIAFIIEATFYGVFLMLFVACMWLLVIQPSKQPIATRRPTQKIYVTASVLFFVLLTAHFGINFDRTLEAFIIFGQAPGPLPGPLLYFANSQNPKYLAKHALWVASTVTADLLMAYRAYKVWGSVWAAIGPLILIAGTAVSASMVIYEFSVLAPTQDIFVTVLGHWIVTSFVVVLCTNILCTSLVAWKLWKSHRSIGQHTFGASNLLRVVNVVVESAAIYGLLLLITLILYLCKSNGQFITLDPLCPLAGIVFSLVIVRVGLAAQNHTTGQLSSSRAPAMSAQSRGYGHEYGTQSRGYGHEYGRGPVKNIEIGISREQDIEGSPSTSFELGTPNLKTSRWMDSDSR